MSGSRPSSRADDNATIRAALRRIKSNTDVPLVFGGAVTANCLHLSEFVGARTQGIRGLRVALGTGLGGRVVLEGRARDVVDYGSADTITHDHDRAILGEGIKPLAAAPATVGGRVRAVLYAATRDGDAPLGGRTIDALGQAARALSQELWTRDEVDRRVEQALASTVGAERTDRRPMMDPGLLETMRELQAELRTLAHEVGDDPLRARLREMAERLAGSGRPRPDTVDNPLSTRETDVLAQVALGCTNVETADRLSITTETVKSYLRSAMAKLNASTRLEAVSAARRRGLLL